MHKSPKKELLILGKWSEDKLDRILKKASKIKTAARTIDFLSERFIGVNYKESTLIGDKNTKEVLVINLNGVDCFTFIDYIEAMRISGSFSEFQENLRRIRYKSGRVSFKSRNHFFTDWIESNQEFVSDVTEKIGGRYTVKSQKVLNTKNDGTYFLLGIKPKNRVIKYIPSERIDSKVIARLKTGDYVGIYCNEKGLDVSHVGIIIKAKAKVYLRHASSIKRKMVDEEFKKYMAGKTGIVVLRHK
ncbi:MAG: DUF1460 domain-containing protein [Nitrospirae bacterium]|nr:DUF1460 domain-containing protein [Nitrospirota bacterium]